MGRPSRLLRPRVIVYAAALSGLVSALVLVGVRRPAAEVTVLRGLGAPFSVTGPQVVNQLRLKVTNRSDKTRHFDVQVIDFPDAQVVAPELPLSVPPAEQATANLFVTAPASAIRGAKHVRLRVGDSREFQTVDYTLMGPQRETP